MKSFCEVTNRNELADFLRIRKSTLTYVLYVRQVDNLYNSFTIPKKDGSLRQISSPHVVLKKIQKKLANALWEYQLTIWKKRNIHPNMSHAFEKHKSIITNATIHKNKRFILNLDLENYFDSFHFGRVKGYFEKNNNFLLPTSVATILAQLTCYRGTLPQGAPTSPIITNMICQILDNRLLKIAKKYKADYTRYADDLTFSTNRRDFLEDYSDFYRDITREIENAGFKINDKKQRLFFKDSKQIVTGLVVNDRVNIDHIYYKKTRAMAHRLYTTGQYDLNGSAGTIEQLEGRFSFINCLDHYNNRLNNAGYGLDKLNGREREYQKFLFYKYLYAHNMPLIITEGKTDILLLTAALKKMYTEYPNLIIKVDDNTAFWLNISFLHRSQRLHYFLGMSQDGADAMQSIYKFFIDDNKDRKRYPNYASYFYNICQHKPLNPVFLLYDNEMCSKNKPLYKFVNSQKISDDQRKNLQHDLYLELIKDRNIFLLTLPLLGEAKECEIEDLIDEAILETIIDGKSFSRNSEFDTTRFYGKEIFSRYVASHYNEINFDNFKPLFNAIDEVIRYYHSS
ncbi:retron Ec67 family RNA-directed DNA polymerase/endonuclease [uncultured Cloacibacillus sp.]|uniref:retron Ec67 family RNA-directed DNA polymerase/endonuclease n=1 Tax=uncultured Cloacibacillus sp. TaxID=889794 RepID=UPI00320965A0